MYLGALCSGILESLADVEKAALTALSAPHHQGRVWPAIRRALHIRSKKVDDPEDPSSPPQRGQEAGPAADLDGDALRHQRRLPER